MQNPAAPPAGVQPGNLIMPPQLPDDVVEEILTRFPPDEPSLLVRAALACKAWCRFVSGAGFRRRLHRAPPLLGFFNHHGSHPPSFNPTSPPFRPPYSPRAGWFILNARHGRFLVARKVTTSTSPFATPSMEAAAELIVWDPTTDEQHRLPMPPFKYSTWSATLVCAAAAAAVGGCDHFNCPKGPFLVVFVFTNNVDKGIMSACVYSSEQGAWREPTIAHCHCQGHGCWHSLRMRGPIVLVKNAIIYFGCDKNTSVLEYDLGKQKLSMIGLPPVCYCQDVVLMTADGGGLGFAIVQNPMLCLRSREAGSGGGYDTWVQQRVIELDKLLPDRGHRFGVDYEAVAIADDLGVVFIWEDYWSLFTVDLRSNLANKKVGHVSYAQRSTRGLKVGHVGSALGIVPYTNFYTPALREAFTGEEARAAA